MYEQRPVVLPVPYNVVVPFTLQSQIPFFVSYVSYIILLAWLQVYSLSSSLILSLSSFMVFFACFSVVFKDSIVSCWRVIFLDSFSFSVFNCNLVIRNYTYTKNIAFRTPARSQCLYHNYPCEPCSPL